MTLKFEEVCFSYGAEPILKNVTFEIEKGEFLGIIGPNGGGKTTLLKLIMGFLKPTSGKISVFGESPQKAFSQIGWVPQGFDFDRQFPITVLEVVLGGRLSKAPWFGGFGAADKRAAGAALEKVGLSSFSRAAFADLSGGQAQRVLIARALAGSPSLLLLDEPTANVDGAAEKEILKCLDSLKGEVTILMVTHNMHAVENRVKRILSVQTRAIILPAGKVCEHFALGLYHDFLPEEEKR